jgi:hypothetical protein
MSVNEGILPLQQTNFSGTITNTPAPISAGSVVFYTPPKVKWTQQDYLREFATLTEKMKEITARKNNDYARRGPLPQLQELILVRMSDKFSVRSNP